MEKWGVYILRGKRYYVGYTGDLEKRLIEHKKGTTKTTREIGERELVKFIECESKTQAISLEMKIKRSGHIERYIYSSVAALRFSGGRAPQLFSYNIVGLV